MVRVAGIGALLACAALWLAPAAGAATLKDDFASRENVKTAPVTATGSNVGAGRESGEPIPTALSAAGHTLWLGWEAPSSSYYTFSTCASSVPTVLAFYVGDEVDELSERQSQANFGGPECSAVRDGVTSGFLTGGKVQVMVDGNNFYVPPALPPATEGSLALQIEQTPPPPNDDFANAAALSGQIFEEPDGNRSYFGSRFGYNYNATKQTGEPNHAGDSGGSSVWYTWTPPESGVARFSLCCMSTANLLALYAGDAIDALLPLKSGKGAVEFPVAAGTTYRLAVESEFSLFLGGTFDDKFDLMVQMDLDPNPGPGAGGGPPVATPPDTIPPETTSSKRVISPKRLKKWMPSACVF